MTDDVQATIARLWQRSRPLVLQRVAALQETATALAIGRLDAEEIRTARAEAHKLVGSLGTFGVERGSELARRVEHELETGGQDPARLADLTAQLHTVVEAS